MTDIAAPAPAPDQPSDIDAIESALDRFLERRVFGWAPRIRSIMLVLTFGLSLWCSGHKIGPLLMSFLPGAASAASPAAPIPTGVPGLDREPDHH